MPYCVDGLVEIGLTFDDEEPIWLPALNLGYLGLRGDALSDYLFGLCKAPSGRARFAGRGWPIDCSDLAQKLATDNEAFVARYGEGDFGHSHATLAEIESALADDDAPVARDSPWHEALAAVRALSALRPHTVPTHWRVIVWANW